MNQLLNKYKTGIVLGICLIWMMACSEEKVGQTPTDSIPPQPVKVTEVKPTPGGGIIYYELPNETDISYVKGEYMFQGKKKVIRASIYNNYLVVEGLGSIEPVEITLWMVDHSENISTPVKESFIPLTPPHETIFDSMELEPDFAGVHVMWDNPLALEIGLTLYATDSEGALTERRTYYTAMKKGSYTFRGFNTEEREFAVKVTDKWGNESGVKSALIVPFFEQMLTKSKIQRLTLAYDNTTEYSSGTTFRNIFNNTLTDLYQTAEGKSFPLPLLLTMDLNATAKLSRFVLYPRCEDGGRSYYYAHHNIRLFELWGTKTIKTGMPDEYWWEDWKADWEMLGDYEVVKPSGEGAITNEDRAIAKEGFEFSVPIDRQSMRYIRLVMKQTWSGGDSMEMSELSLYGKED